jgi:hypothetical protein
VITHSIAIVAMTHMEDETGNFQSHPLHSELGDRNRRGWLLHGNPPGNLASAPRCGARTRGGAPCKNAAMANGRCRMHGGLSTGARTAAGRERCRMANFRHGRFTMEAKEKRRQLRQLVRQATTEVKAIRKQLDRLERRKAAGAVSREDEGIYIRRLT